MGYLLGFSGRFGRGDWWMAQIVIVALIALTLVWIGASLSLAELNRKALTGRVLQHGPITLAPLLACVWISLAASVKRYHDRDKSGWWCLVSVVPYVGQLWQFVECGFLAGTPGANSYGEGYGRRAAQSETDGVLAARMRFADQPYAGAGFTTEPAADSETRFLGRPRADVAPVLFGRRSR